MKIRVKVAAAAPISAAGRDYFRELVTSAPIIKEGKAIGAISVAQTAVELSSRYVELASDLEGKFGENAHLFLFSDGGELVSELRYNQEASACRDNFAGVNEVIL